VEEGNKYKKQEKERKTEGKEKSVKREER